MLFNSVILSLTLIGVTTSSVVKGLQCYVCEDCNEYEDFKELHICGEISIDSTMKPITLPAVLNHTTNKPLNKPSSKPILAGNSEQSIYEDKDGTHGEVTVQTQRKTTESTPTKISTVTESITTVKPVSSTKKSTTKKRITLTETYMDTTVNKLQETAPKTKISTTLSVMDDKTTTATTTTKPKPIQLPDYDDYIEYEDSILERRNSKSLLKINEPICYMIKYNINNTIITNRGCTTFINSNKYLTCQSLHNGTPMETCRICSTNGCNKFLSNNTDEDEHGILLNAAGTFENFKIFVVSLWALLIPEI